MPHGKRGPDAHRDPGPAVITDHSIRPADIHPNVLFVCQRLREHGHTALVVGGAVRDLLLGRHPKDFDLATSARPEVVKGLFRNARIIGRRFRLAQLRYPNMAIEVATFRGEPRDKRQGMIRRDNRYGTSEEDARRRDFTINALTFDPISLTLYDYVGGLPDLRAGRIRTIKPPHDSIREDPVRMLRAVRFKVRLGFTIHPECEAAIGELAPTLREVKRHRLAEELQRFLTRGNAEAAFHEFDRLGLLHPLLDMRPHRWFFAPQALKGPLHRLEPYLRRMDAWVAQGGEPIAPTVALLGVLAALGHDAYRAWLRGDEPRDMGSLLRNLRTRFPQMLSEWGLLNGQVVPALAIQEAARALVGSGGALLRNREEAARVSGIREALLLVAVLRDVLEVPDAWVQQALPELAQLPDLPILDHPRPLLRGTQPHAPPGAKRRGRRRRRTDSVRPEQHRRAQGRQ